MEGKKNMLGREIQKKERTPTKEDKDNNLGDLNGGEV